MPSCAPRTPTMSLCREPDTEKTAKSNRRTKRDLDSAMFKAKNDSRDFRPVLTGCGKHASTCRCMHTHTHVNISKYMHRQINIIKCHFHMKYTIRTTQIDNKPFII